MPESKRNKVVSLTQVKPKPREHKEFIVNKVHNYMANYKYLYVLTYENMSTNNFKTLKESLTDSKFLMGKNKVIGVALGTDEENSYKPHSHLISQVLLPPYRTSRATAPSSLRTGTTRSADKSSSSSRRASTQLVARLPPTPLCSKRAWNH